MYIVNAHGITHSIPDDWEFPAGARRATPDEINAYEGDTVPTAAPVAGALELVNTISEKDAEIARLQAALAEAISEKQGKAK